MAIIRPLAAFVSAMVAGVLQLSFNADDIEFEKDAPKFQEPLVFKLRLQRTGKYVEVDGHLDAVVGLNCGRCLQDFELSLSESFSVTFVPRGNEDEPEEEVELDADELGLVTYVDETIELHDTLQEQLLMAVPISPLCHEDCLGSCAQAHFGNAQLLDE